MFGTHRAAACLRAGSGSPGSAPERGLWSRGPRAALSWPGPGAGGLPTPQLGPAQTPPGSLQL